MDSSKAEWKTDYSFLRNSIGKGLIQLIFDTIRDHIPWCSGWVSLDKSDLVMGMVSKPKTPTAGTEKNITLHY